MESRIRWKSYVRFGGRSFISFEIHPTIWGQKAKIKDLSPYKKKTDSWTPFTLMSRRGTAEKKTAKSDPIYRNRLVNMLVNRILKHGKKSLAYQIIYRAVKKIQQKKKDRNKSTIRFTSSNTWSNSRYNSKSKTCRWIDSSSSHWNRIHTRKSTCHSLVISGIPKTSGSKYGF